jgi:hypothetical protein
MLAADGVATIETDDAARMDEIAGVIAADINSDGRITAVDALQVINHINAAQSSDAGSETVRDGVNRVVDTVFSRIANLDTDGNGRVTEVDALRVINRINDGVDSVVDSVLSRLPQLNRNGQIGPVVGSEVRGMVGELLKGLNSVRSRADLSPGRIARLVNEVATVAGEAQRPSATSIGSLVRTWQSSLSDRELSTSELAAIRSDLTSVLSSAGVNTGRVNAVWDDVESIVRNTDLDVDDVRSVLGNVQRIVEALPERVTTEFPQLSRPLTRIVDSLVRLGGEPTRSGVLAVVSTASELLDEIRATDLSLPSLSSVMTFFNEYVRARADGTVDTSELSGLADDVDAVFASMGLQESTRDQLVDRFVSLFEAGRASR